VHLLKASRSEMSELAAQPLPDLAAWRRTCENLVSLRKADIVALSLGPDGALLATSAGVWRAAAPAMASANAVGAGDSFLGSLVSTLAGGTAPADALPVAVAAGSAAMLAAGTGLCERAHVTRLAKDVVVERLR
jgi:6-phosphofructokinase 2